MGRGRKKKKSPPFKGKRREHYHIPGVTSFKSDLSAPRTQKERKWGSIEENLSMTNFQSRDF